MMIYLLVFLIVGVFLLNFYSSRWNVDAGQSRRKKTKPDADKPTMFQVRDLIIKGEKDMAVELYCRIFPVSREEALTAVNELERSIQNR